MSIQKIMDFPKNKFEISTIVTKIFFSNLMNLIYRKINIRSHFTGEIIKYAHDFCNQKVREINFFFSLHIIFSAFMSSLP